MKSRNFALLALALVAILAVVIGRFGSDSKSTNGNRGDSGAVGTNPQDEVTKADSKRRESSRVADRMLKAEGAKTDVTLSSFPIKEYQHLPSPAGKPASITESEAYIHVPSAGHRVAIAANQLGEYPKVETKLSDTVGVRVGLDGVKPGTPVRVVILDGGSFPTVQGASQVLKTADWHGVAFEYTTSANIGTHRVLVQAVGQPSRIFDFSAHDSRDSWPAPSADSTN